MPSLKVAEEEVRTHRLQRLPRGRREVVSGGAFGRRPPAPMPSVPTKIGHIRKRWEPDAIAERGCLGSVTEHGGHGWARSRASWRAGKMTTALNGFCSASRAPQSRVALIHRGHDQRDPAIRCCRRCRRRRRRTQRRAAASRTPRERGHESVAEAAGLSL